MFRTLFLFVFVQGVARDPDCTDAEYEAYCSRCLANYETEICDLKDNALDMTGVCPDCPLSGHLVCNGDVYFDGSVVCDDPTDIFCVEDTVELAECSEANNYCGMGMSASLVHCQYYMGGRWCGGKEDFDSFMKGEEYNFDDWSGENYEAAQAGYWCGNFLAGIWCGYWDGDWVFSYNYYQAYQWDHRDQIPSGGDKYKLEMGSRAVQACLDAGSEDCDPMSVANITDLAVQNEKGLKTQGWWASVVDSFVNQGDSTESLVETSSRRRTGTWASSRRRSTEESA